MKRESESRLDAWESIKTIQAQMYREQYQGIAKYRFL